MGRRSALLLNVCLVAVVSFGFMFKETSCSPTSGDLSTPLIVGGEPAQRGEFPWIVSVQTRVVEGLYKHACGGTIVNANHVVTAAHCIPQDFMDGDFRLVAGAHFINRTESTQQVRSIKRSTRHADFAGENSPFDIALVEVSEPFEFNSRVAQLQMPPADIVSSGICEIAGWGQKNVGDITIHPELLKAQIPIVSKERCAEVYGTNFHADTMMCAGTQEGGVDACNGDTGGALVCSDLGYKYFAGIASWGYGCAQPDKPGVYTDVAKFIFWIHSSPH